MCLLFDSHHVFMSSRQSSTSRLKVSSLQKHGRGEVVGKCRKPVPVPVFFWRKQEFPIASGLVWMKILKNAKWLDHLIRSPTSVGSRWVVFWKGNWLCNFRGFICHYLRPHFLEGWLTCSMLNAITISKNSCFSPSHPVNHHQSPIPHILFSSSTTNQPFYAQLLQ